MLHDDLTSFTPVQWIYCLGGATCGGLQRHDMNLLKAPNRYRCDGRPTLPRPVPIEYSRIKTDCAEAVMNDCVPALGLLSCKLTYYDVRP